MGKRLQDEFFFFFFFGGGEIVIDAALKLNDGNLMRVPDFWSNRGPLSSLVERLPSKQKVAGSIPAVGSTGA